MDTVYPVTASPLVDVGPVVDVLSVAESSNSELLNTPGSKGYISHLATLPLTELSQEPLTLQTQSHHLTSSLTSFTHASYPTFISLHKNITSFASSIESLSSSLNILLNTSLPVLEDSTDVWKDRLEAILLERNKARVVLEQHEKIRDLLDIPVLIDTCVRNGHFGEALSLAGHVASLIHRAKDNPPPAILTSVLVEVQHSMTQMHLLLLSILYEPNKKLPALWKAVSFLRKMDAFVVDSTPSPLTLLRPRSSLSSQQDAFTKSQRLEPSSEEYLALSFLIGRESCLKATLETTGRDIQRLVKQVSEKESDNNVEYLARYLKKYIDAWRESVYNIMTQYMTIFLERSPTRMDTTIDPEKDDILIFRLRTLLRTYSTRALSMHLFAILKPSLFLLTLSHLPSLLTQLNYCSTAFSRLGLDFRCFLVGGGGLFSTAILSIVSRDFKAVAKKWEGRLGSAYGASMSSSSRNASASTSRRTIGLAKLPSNWLVSPPAVDTPPLPPLKQKSEEIGPAHIPPQLLASYPPVAQLTNAVLAVFNGLRLVVPRGNGDSPLSVEGIYKLLELLDNIILSQCSTGLLNYLQFVVKWLREDGNDISDEEEKAKENERGLVIAVGRAFFEVFVAFVRRALVEGVYGFQLEDVIQEGKGEISKSWVENKKLFETIVMELSGEKEEEEEEY